MKNISFDDVCKLTRAKKSSGDKATGHCPCPDHPDHNPSLGIWIRDGRVHYKCMSRGCSREAIRAGLSALQGSTSGSVREVKRIEPSVPTGTRPERSLTPEAYLASKGLDISALQHSGLIVNERDRCLEFILQREGRETGRHFVHSDRLSESGTTDKTTRGVLQGSAIVLTGCGDHYVCEGPITGLSLWLLTRGTVHVTCGAENMKNISLDAARAASVTVVADCDEPGVEGAVALCEVLLRRDGIAARLCRLDEGLEVADELTVIQSVKGFDFNDAHRLLGAEWALGRLQLAEDWRDARKRYWEEPDLASVPAADSLPLDGLPQPVASFVREQAHAIQVHPDRILGSLLCVIGSLACGRFSLRLRSASDGYIAHPNLYLAQVGRPSARKSPAMAVARDFLRRAVTDQAKRRQEGLAKVSSLKKSKKAKSDGLLSEIKKPKDPAATQAKQRQLEELELELTSLEMEPVPYDPIYTTDATPEALVSLLAGSSRALLLYFDEASKLIKQMAREGFAEIRSLLTAGFAGNEPYRCDRVTVYRPHIEALRLGFLCGIQPDVLQPLMTSEDDGLLARVLFVNPAETESRFVDEPQSWELRQAVQSIVDALYEAKSERVLSFSPEALALFATVYNENDALKRAAIGQSRHLEGFLGKHETIFAKLCLTLHLLNVPVADEVQVTTVAAAHGIYKALVTHYQKTVHQGFGNHPVVAAAMAGRLDEIKTVRGLKKGGLGADNEAALNTLLKTLEEKKVLRVIETKCAGRPSQVLVLSPHVRKQDVPLEPQTPETPIPLPIADTFGAFGTFGKVCINPQCDAGVPVEAVPAIRLWSQEDGCLGSTVAVDTETTAIVGSEAPELKLMQACANPDLVYFVRPRDARAFLDAHREAKLVFHNFPFDCAVLQRATGIDLVDRLLEDHARIIDTALLYRLVELAEKGEVPKKWSLATVAHELLGAELVKDDDVRLSWDVLSDAADDFLGSLTPEQRSYAAQDAGVTLRCWQVLQQRLARLQAENQLSLLTQIQGAWALDRVQRRGIAVDQDLLRHRLETLNSAETRLRTELQTLGYIPSKLGNRNVLEAELEKLCVEAGKPLITTAKSGKPKIDEGTLAPWAGRSPLIKAYLQFVQLKKQKDFLVKMDEPRIFPRYDALLRTGRTSCSSPNIQNLPRTGIREVLVPTPGHCFIIADYAGIELVTLAQHCLTRYGHSKMAVMINEGKDLHTELARHILKTHDVSTEDRRKAKALNFGIPGGLGAERLCDYAAATFGVRMSLEEARTFKSSYLKLFPEVAEHLKSGDGQNEVVSTLSGRIAANCSYTQARNFVFQGLAADGAKRALFYLERAGFKVVAFIHDEVIVEVPCQGPEDGSLESVGQQIETIMIDGMRHFTPDVAVKVEWYAADRWSKDGKLARDAHDRVVPFVVEVDHG